MTNRRIANIALGAGLLLLGLAARSQQRPVRVGWLLNTNPRSASFNASFERRLKELGYVERNNLIIDDVYAEGKLERLAPLARELVARKPDVLFVSGPEAPLKALSEATTSIPIVVCAVDFDPQERGYVKSLARPGRNITGLHVQQIEATSKRLQLLHDLSPSARRIAVLADLFTADQLEAARKTAQLLKLDLQVLEMRDYPYDFAMLLDQARAARSEAVLVLMSPRVFPGRESLVAEVRKQRLPAVYGLTHYVDAGGLASYGASLDALFVRAAEYVDKVIKGESPSNIPMEQPREFDLEINLKVAKELGIKIPQSILLRATKVIE
jgi:putative ABC transport system substrate-binding protein